MYVLYKCMYTIHTVQLLYTHVLYTHIHVMYPAHGRSFGRGVDTVGNPPRAQIYRFELLELTPLVETRQTVHRRAIRAISISVNSTLPPPLTKAA